jgi:Phage endonuclease I
MRRTRKIPIPKPFRSMLEFECSKYLLCPYESNSFDYVKTHSYTPDFQLSKGVYLEVKGLFKASDRGKHLVFRKENPDVKIIFAFQDPHRKLNKSSKTSYADWATKNGFEWIDCTPESLIEIRKRYTK